MEIVNGFMCKNCTDVDYAKKHIDPAHPKDGPYGVNNLEKQAEARREKAVKFGGALSALDPSGPPTSRPPPAGLVDLRV